MRRLVCALTLIGLSCSFPDYRVREVDTPARVVAEPAPPCRDGVRGGDEVDIDCGPACAAGCATGKVCSADRECASGFCAQGLCAIPSCGDGAKNRTETDVDCGGSDGCTTCAVGRGCASVFDCGGGGCVAGRCQAPSCSDGIQNQAESDVDCGGKQACGPCLSKQRCVDAADCLNAQCAQGRCQSQGCGDSVKNGDETDVDCGGSCASCSAAATCQKGDDCGSAVCDLQSATCLAASCDDGVRNGDEPATDCGQSCPAKCPMTSACLVDADCTSGASCAEKRCVPKAATGGALPTTGWTATAAATFGKDTLPGNVLDGNGATHWTSGLGQAPGQWFQVDLQKTLPFFGIELNCTSNDDYARSVRVLLSDDGQTFKAATGTIAGISTLRIGFATARVARYIKLELEQDTGALWWRIDELRVFQ